MRYIVFDLEATCWENVRNPEQQEIIEIGAVALSGANGPAVSEFGRFVKPVATHELSRFCTKLTSITQSDVDKAEIFPFVFADFAKWIGDDPFTLCSWGGYDLNQLRKDCARHNMPLPAAFERHINLKREFSRWKNVKPMGMKGALHLLQIPLAGTHHRGIDDARNIGLIAAQLLPWIEAHPTE